MAVKYLLFIALLFLQSCAIHKIMVTTPTAAPELYIPKSSRVALAADPDLKDSEKFSKIILSRFRSFQSRKVSFGSSVVTPQVDGTMNICDGNDQVDYLIVFHDFEIVNKQLGVFIIGWENDVKYAVKAVLLQNSGCKVLAAFESKGFGLNNGFNTGFGEIGYGDSIKPFDAEDPDNERSLGPIREARDNAADDMERKILKMMKIGFIEI